MTRFRQPPQDLKKWWCGGELVPLIESESSMRCTECGWIGWPQKEVATDNSGRILSYYPHRRDTGRHRQFM